MLFGLTFKCNGETAQIRIANDLRLEFRITQNGEWQAWKRADVERAADGSLAEAVMESVTAKQAQKLRTPMKITFEGDAAGSVAFDGSANVTCSLSMNADVVNRAVDSAVSEHVRRYHGSVS